VVVFDRDRRLGYLNRAGLALLDARPADVLGRTLPELVEAGAPFGVANRRRAEVLHQILVHTFDGGTVADDETTLLLRDGSTGTYSWRLDPIPGDGTATGAVLVLRDVTEQSNATFQAAPVGMFRVRGDGEVLELNGALRTLLGLDGQGPLLRPLRDLIHADDRQFHDAMFAEFVDGGRHRYQAERRMLAGDGRVVWCHLTMSVPRRRTLAAEQWFDRVVGVVEDITARKQLESELRSSNTELARLARTDPLTGLYNRRHVEERLAEAASSARRHGDGLCVVLVDVDRFRRLNDRYGHPAGDEVLRTVASRIRAAKRTEDVARRWGGEEFLVLLPHTPTSGALVFAERLREAVSTRPATAGGTEIPVTVSVGVAGDGTDVEELLRRAELCLSAAKAAGRDRVASVPSTVDGVAAA